MTSSSKPAPHDASGTPSPTTWTIFVALTLARMAARSRSGSGAASARSAEPGRGRNAAKPTDIPAAGWKDILWRLYGEVNEDRILAVAAGVTFFGLLALFPAIASFVALYGLFSDYSTINDHLNTISFILPGGAIDVIGEQVKRITSKPTSTLGFAFFSGLAVSLWSTNAGMKAMFDALNVAYEETEKRSFVMLNLQSLFFTLSAIVFLMAAMGSIVVIPLALKFLGLDKALEWVISLARWPALFVLTVLALAVLYRYGPSRRKAKWRWVTPGSMIATVGWLATSMLFSWYVANFGNYNETYGSLGAVIGFMTWLWLSTTIVLVGAELNAEIEHQTTEDSTRGPEKPMGQRGATVADTVGAAAA